LDVDEERQPTRTESRGQIPEGGPIPLHRDTTIYYIIDTDRLCFLLGITDGATNLFNGSAYVAAHVR